MRENLKHDAWLKFVRSAADVVIGRSRDDLVEFRRVAKRENPKLVRLIEEYIAIVERSETEVQITQKTTRRPSSRQMHLFDLLRDKTLFPHNADLSRFALRVVPNLRALSHVKLSRSQIAAQIVDFLENSDLRNREALERSMRDALNALKHGNVETADRGSFFSKWERIIKGIEI